MLYHKYSPDNKLFAKVLATQNKPLPSHPFPTPLKGEKVVCLSPISSRSFPSPAGCWPGWDPRE